MHFQHFLFCNMRDLFIIFFLQMSTTIILSFAIICVTQALVSSSQSSSPDLAAPPPFSPSFRSFCKPRRRRHLVRQLNKIGGKSMQGGYNPRYMALTWTEARKFTDLVTSSSLYSRGNSSKVFIFGLPLFAPRSAGTILSQRNCHTTDNGLHRLCSACPAVTFLGADKVPPYINEVRCVSAGFTSCISGKGACKSTMMHQTFLRKTGRCHPVSGYEILEEYVQPIRVCCECMAFAPPS